MTLCELSKFRELYDMYRWVCMKMDARARTPMAEQCKHRPDPKTMIPDIS